MYGARVIKSLSGADRVHMEFNAGGTFAANDFVKFDSSGEIVVGTAGNGILGVAVEAGASGTDNVLIDISPYMVVLMDNDNDSHTFDAGDVGHTGNFTGGTGAMQVDTSDLADTVGQLRCLAYNPQGYGYDDDTSIGLFFVIERMLGEMNVA
jgi:hypothetical protein